MDQLAAWLKTVGSLEAFEQLANLFGDQAVFVVDRDRNVIFWSDGAEDLLGISAEEVLGSHCLKANRCMQCMTGCGIAEHGEINGARIEMHTGTGGVVQVTKNGRAFFDADGEFIGGIETLERAGSEARAALAPAGTSLPVLPPSDIAQFHGIMTRDPEMLRIVDVIKNVAASDVTVLIRGESGTGKELVARALHEESHRSEGPFVAVNCAAFAPNLLESELFGHEKGAFTGAVREHRGVFEQADGGTLFLDEVAELPPELQAKLLRVLQERTFSRVGGTRQISVDVRILAATHRSLRAEVAAGRFRDDLMYRLRVVPIFVPPLRDRRGDIALLTDHFIAELNRRGQRHVRALGPDAMRAVLDYDWPGNVRELQNVLEYAFAVGRGPEIQLRELPPEFRTTQPAPVVEASSPKLDGQRYRALEPKDEKEAIRRALQQAGGHIGRAATFLGMSRPTLWRKRKRYGL